MRRRHLVLEEMAAAIPSTWTRPEASAFDFLGAMADPPGRTESRAVSPRADSFRRMPHSESRQRQGVSALSVQQPLGRNPRHLLWSMRRTRHPLDAEQPLDDFGVP